MKILFQGDSITDAGRVKDNDANVGTGYPLLIKASLGFSFPGKCEFVNRGISGNRVVDVYARMKRDIINIKPDIMSILIGVNDVWHELSSSPDGVDADKYYNIYSMLIEELKQTLPEMKIMIMEPFVLKASSTEGQWDYFKQEVLFRAEMAKKVARENNLIYIPLQEGFDELTKHAPSDYWLCDGVHPTPMGHEYIKNEWIKAFKSIC